MSKQRKVKSDKSVNKAVANTLDVNLNDLSTLEVLNDSRPETIIQQKLQTLINNSSAMRLLRPIVNKPKQTQTNNIGSVAQLSPLYDAIETTANAHGVVTNGEIEAATKELIGEMLAGQNYVDADGRPVTQVVINAIPFIFDADYAASADMIMMPTNAAILNDIRAGNFKMSMMHEMGHYIRSIGNQTAAASYADAEAVINALNWTDIALQYPNGNMEYWKEEIRADLKGISLQYAQDGSLPSDARINAFGATLGGADAMHPPSNMRIRAMRNYVARIRPRGRCCCYLTTACIENKGLPDDCEELTCLRDFRDSYLLKRTNGVELVELYYMYSPQIVEAIENDTRKNIIYEFIYNVVCECVSAIRRKDLEYAYLKYCEMVVKLKEQFIPEEEIQEYKL